MRRWQIIVPAALALLAVCMLFLPSCSLVGLLIGTGIDNAHPARIRIDSWAVDTLRRGDDVTIALNDGEQFRGVFAGLKRDSLREYRERFSKYCEAYPFPQTYPKPGDSLIVNLLNGRRLQMVFLAYDVDTLVLESGKGIVQRVAASNVLSLETAQTPLSTRALMEWVQYKSVPVLTSVAIAEEPSNLIRLIRIPDIYLITKETSGNAALTGFLVGLAVDAIVVIVILTSQEENKPAPPTYGGGGSCPFIYSHDGRGFALDAEVFNGSIVRSLQRTDTVRLDHLEAVNGIARMKIANRLPETQYIDHFSLTAIDNAAGAEVLPGVTGQLHTISAPDPPLEARGYDGSTVTKSVAARDKSSWISNPAGRDPDDRSSTRDGLTLRFRRPAGARSVKLVLTLRNTQWLTEVEAQLLHLPGSRLEDWYARMNSSTESRDAFVDILKREAMLRVDVWSRGSWEPRTYVPFVGPYVERSLVVPLDLAGMEDDELRIRVESSPGFWMVDRAQADYTPDYPMRQTPMSISRAVDRKGMDVSSLLARVDEEYLVLERGDEVEVAAAGSPARAGDRRTYVLTATGYYTIHVRPEGAPRRDLMVKLANEPGAFGSYSTGMFNLWLDEQLGRRREGSHPTDP